MFGIDAVFGGALLLSFTLASFLHSFPVISYIFRRSRLASPPFPPSFQLTDRHFSPVFYNKILS